MEIIELRWNLTEEMKTVSDVSWMEASPLQLNTIEKDVSIA